MLICSACSCSVQARGPGDLLVYNSKGICECYRQRQGSVTYNCIIAVCRRYYLLCIYVIDSFISLHSLTNYIVVLYMGNFICYFY